MSAAVRRLFSVLSMAAVVTLLLAPGAQAHAGLVGVDPPSGAELDALPAQVTFTFSEPMRDPAFASVIVDGRPVSLPAGDPRIEGADVVVDLAGVTAEGREWTGSYRVVSADGHAIDGSTTFTIPSASVNTDSLAVEEESGNPLSSPWLWGVVALLVVVTALLLVRGRRTPSSSDAS